MKLPHRRQFLHLAAGAVALPAISRFARAQDYPSRPVRVIVSVAPGGANDLVARLMGQWLSERLGQQFVIENRPGAGGNIGTEAVVNSPPDGYTLLLVGSFNAINLPGYEASSWFGIGAPKNTPAENIDRLNKLINSSFIDPVMKGRLADMGGILLAGSPADFGRHIADETEKWAKVIRAANIKPE
jgi:tripartite-type tricarboxylate transporter receptor subunit TctC